MGTSSVVTLPLFCLLTARRFEQNLLELIVAHLAVLTVGPGPFRMVAMMMVTAVLVMAREAQIKQKDSKECQETARQCNSTKTAQGMMRVPLAWWSGPHGGDERGALVGHYYRLLFRRLDLLACQPHLLKAPSGCLPLSSNRGVRVRERVRECVYVCMCCVTHNLHLDSREELLSWNAGMQQQL